MFEGFQRVWTPVELSRRVGRRPVPVRLAGVDLVLFRDKERRVGALVDRCPHRGVALSLGRVNEAGCLECPFHAWSFETGGACARVPLNAVPESKRARLAATALPVREIAGLVWVFTGGEAEVDGEPIVPASLVDPAFSRFYYVETWKTHWTRAMENMLDFPHVPFLHRRTIGRQMRAELRPDSIMDVRWEPTDNGGRIHTTLDGRPQPGSLDWNRPNAMVLAGELGKGRNMRQHLWCVPVDEGHTRMILVSGRDYWRNNPLGWLFDRANRFILLEDRRVVESSRPAEVPAPAAEASVASDGPTLAFRSYYRRVLRRPRLAVAPRPAAVQQDPGSDSRFAG